VKKKINKFQRSWNSIRKMFYKENGKYQLNIVVRGIKSIYKGTFYYRDYESPDEGAHLVLADRKTGNIQIVLRGIQRTRFLKNLEAEEDV